MEIHTDGGAAPNPGFGGAGIYSKKLNIQRFLSFSSVTNNQMELIATIEGYIDFERNGIKKGKIITDSNYVKKGINEWKGSWKKKNWNGVKNKELWQIIDYFHLNFPEIEIHWVKGHSGDHGNESADELATKGISVKSLETIDQYIMKLQEIYQI